MTACEIPVRDRLKFPRHTSNLLLHSAQGKRFRRSCDLTRAISPDESHLKLVVKNAKATVITAIFLHKIRIT